MKLAIKGAMRRLHMGPGDHPSGSPQDAHAGDEIPSETMKLTKTNLNKLISWTTSIYNEFRKKEVVDWSFQILKDDLWRLMWKPDSLEGSGIRAVSGSDDIEWREVESLGGKPRIEVKVKRAVFRSGVFTPESGGAGGDYLINGEEGYIAVGIGSNPWEFTEQERTYFDGAVVQRHLGPGDHPSGSPQSVHAGLDRMKSIRTDKKAHRFLEDTINKRLAQMNRSGKDVTVSFGIMDDKDVGGDVRGLLFSREDGTQLRFDIMEGEFGNDPFKIVVVGMWASEGGTGIGTAAMFGLREYAIAKQKPLEFTAIANLKFFRRFNWLEETDTHDFIFDPTRPVQRHLGPGPHPSGSDQDIHAGDDSWKEKALAYANRKRNPALKDYALALIDVFEANARGEYPSLPDVEQFQEIKFKKGGAFGQVHMRRVPSYSVFGKIWSDLSEMAPPSGSQVQRGGPGSGFFGHAGRPGKVGGSLPAGQSSVVDIHIPDKRGGGWWQDNPQARGIEWEPGRNDLTAGYKEARVDPRDIVKLPGARGEQDFINWAKVAELAKSIKVIGMEYKPLIVIEKDRTAYIWEGNHRVRAAIEAGLETITVEIGYFGGSEELEGIWKPELKAINVYRHVGTEAKLQKAVNRVMTALERLFE